MRAGNFHAGGCEAEGAGLEHQHTPEFLQSELPQAGQAGLCLIMYHLVVL